MLQLVWAKSRKFLKMWMREKSKKGGKRIGAGSKPKYKEPTKTIAFRVPQSKIDEIKLIVKTKLSEWVLK